MKIIIDTDLAAVPGAEIVDNVTSCTADSEDAEFPATNLRDDFTTNLWKAEANTATLTLQVSKGSAVMILNTNAISAVVTAGSGESYTPETGFSLETGYSFADDEVIVVQVFSLPGLGGRLWADYVEFPGPHVVTIELTASGPVYAGIVRGGVVEEFREAAYNHGEGSKDYSIEKEMNNGADYFRKRNIVRTFENLSTVETRANAWKFKHNIFDAVGPKPLAMRLFDNPNVQDWEFVVFAKRIESPFLSHGTLSRTRIDFSLREVI